MADGKIEIRVHARTDIVGSEVDTSFDIDAEEWSDMTEKERQAMCLEIMFDLVEWGYEVVGEEAARG